MSVTAKRNNTASTSASSNYSNDDISVWLCLDYPSPKLVPCDREFPDFLDKDSTHFKIENSLKQLNPYKLYDDHLIAEPGHHFLSSHGIDVDDPSIDSRSDFQPISPLSPSTDSVDSGSIDRDINSKFGADDILDKDGSMLLCQFDPNEDVEPTVDLGQLTPDSEQGFLASMFPYSFTLSKDDESQIQRSRSRSPLSNMKSETRESKAVKKGKAQKDPDARNNENGPPNKRRKQSNTGESKKLEQASETVDGNKSAEKDDEDTAGKLKKDKEPRKQCESRIPLTELHARMSLSHDPDEAKIREQRILNFLKDQGFPLGEKTWIRDTTESDRKDFIEKIYRQTYNEYGYDRTLIEIIVRRGTYYMMQGRLRRIRTNRQKLNAAAAASTTAGVKNGSASRVGSSSSPDEEVSE